MGDQLNRIDRDRALFNEAPKGRLSEVISKANPVIVASVVVKALELQVLTDELAHAGLIDCTPEQLEAFRKSHHDVLTDQLNRAVTLFIGAIVSQEG